MCVSMCGCAQQECGYSERPELLCPPRAGITDSCKGPDRGAGGLNLDPLEEQCMLLTAVSPVP